MNQKKLLAQMYAILLKMQKAINKKGQAALGEVQELNKALWKLERQAFGDNYSKTAKLVDITRNNFLMLLQKGFTEAQYAAYRRESLQLLNQIKHEVNK